MPKTPRANTPRRRKVAVRRKPATPRAFMFVAVVVRNDRLGNEDLSLWSSLRPGGEWSSFVGTDREKVVAEALSAARRWNHPGQNRYEVWLGILDGLVQVPVPKYNVVSLKRVK